jgi:hypothetical protein
MTESECLDRMIAPGTRRPGKWGGGGVIQILVTHSCDKACVNCTQGSQLAAPRWDMTPEQFEQACLSLKGYFGVIGVFGGNPALSRHFADYCEIIARHFPLEQRGLWCNNPITVQKAALMRKTFNPRVSNLNVHMDKRAWDTFKEGWPESLPFGLDKDSRHSPPWVAMVDADKLPVFDDRHRVVSWMHNTEGNRLHLINQHWSAGIGVFRGELRAWFCEIAMAQSIRHQHEESYPDTGVRLWGDFGSDEKPTSIDLPWWVGKMDKYAHQVRKHCHECGVPMRGYGELALAPNGKEQVSKTHEAIYVPKSKGRAVELVTLTEQLECGKINKTTHYVQNAAR